MWLLILFLKKATNSPSSKYIEQQFLSPKSYIAKWSTHSRCQTKLVSCFLVWKKSCLLFSWQFFRDLLWLQWCFCLFLSTWWWWGWRDGPQSSHPSHSSYLILSCPPLLNWVAAGKGVLENVTKTEIQMKEQLRKKMECVPNNTTWRKEREILFWWKKFLTWTRAVFEPDYLKSFKVPYPFVVQLFLQLSINPSNCDCYIYILLN